MFKKLLFGVGVIALLQGCCVLIGYPRFFYDIGLYVWNKAENDVFAEFVMKLLSLVGLLWVTTSAGYRALYFANRNINYDEVRVQLIHFIDGVFCIESLKGSGTELAQVVHNRAYRNEIHRMLKAEDEDSVLPLWRHKWGMSIVGAIAEFVNSVNSDANVDPQGFYIVPSVIRTEQHTTCLTLQLMNRETMEQLRNIKKLHSARVVVGSHMDRLVVAHHAADLFLYEPHEPYGTPDDHLFMDYTRKCFRALRINFDGRKFLETIQAELRERGERVETMIDWKNPDVCVVLKSFGRGDVVRELIQLQQDAAQATAATPASA